MRHLAFVLALLVPASVLARGGARTTNCTNQTSTTSTNKYNLLESVDLSTASEANRTVTVQLRKRWATMKVSLFYTDTAGTASAVTATMSCSNDGTTFAVPAVRDLTSSPATFVDLVDSRDPNSANFSTQLQYGVGGCEAAKVLFAGTGAGAGDVVNVQVTVCTGE